MASKASIWLTIAALAITTPIFSQTKKYSFDELDSLKVHNPKELIKNIVNKSFNKKFIKKYGDFLQEMGDSCLSRHGGIFTLNKMYTLLPKQAFKKDPGFFINLNKYSQEYSIGRTYKSINKRLVKKHSSELLSIAKYAESNTHMAFNALPKRAFKKDPELFVDISKITKRGTYHYYKNYSRKIIKDNIDFILEIAKKSNLSKYYWLNNVKDSILENYKPELLEIAKNVKVNAGITIDKLPKKELHTNINYFVNISKEKGASTIYYYKVMDWALNHNKKELLDSIVNLSSKEIKSASYRYDQYYEPRLNILNSVKQFNISKFQRYRGTDLLETIIENVADTSSSKPVALIILNKNDHNGAFNRDNDQLEKLTKAYKLFIYETNSDTGAYKIINQTYQTQGEISVLGLGGHGTMQSLILGKYSWLDNSTIDLSDENELREHSHCLADTAIIILDACLNGKEEEKGDNLANMAARVFPGREVYARTISSSSNELFFDENDNLINVVLGSKKTTYKTIFTN